MSNLNIIIFLFVFIYILFTDDLRAGLLILIFLPINLIVRLDYDCPSCGYKIDRSKLGPVTTSPDKICRCGQDKTIDEAESLKVRNNRRIKEMDK